MLLHLALIIMYSICLLIFPPGIVHVVVYFSWFSFPSSLSPCPLVAASICLVVLFSASSASPSVSSDVCGIFFATAIRFILPPFWPLYMFLLFLSAYSFLAYFASSRFLFSSCLLASDPQIKRCRLHVLLSSSFTSPIDGVFLPPYVRCAVHMSKLHGLAFLIWRDPWLRVAPGCSVF